MQPDVPAAGGSVCELCGEGAYGNMSGDRALALVRPAKLDGKLVSVCMYSISQAGSAERSTFGRHHCALQARLRTEIELTLQFHVRAS